MKKIKKRGAVYGVIALLLCAAAYLNWSYVDTPEDLLAAQQTDTQADTQTDASADSTTGEGDYFASSRLTRTQAMRRHRFPHWQTTRWPKPISRA